MLREQSRLRPCDVLAGGRTQGCDRSRGFADHRPARDVRERRGARPAHVGETLVDPDRAVVEELPDGVRETEPAGDVGLVRFEERDRERPSGSDDRDTRSRRIAGRERRLGGGNDDPKDKEDRRDRDKERDQDTFALTERHE